MPNFIKNAADEKAWNEALDLARKRHEERSQNPQLEPIKNIWAYANWLMHNLFKENSSLVLEEQGLINSESDQYIWESIRNHTFFNKKDLSEEQKYEYIENAFLAYKEKHNGTPTSCRRQLLEFVNTYAPTLGSSMMGGTASTGALMGFGGIRDERPKGPMVYGFDNYPSSSLDQSSLNNKKAVVVIPDKKDEFKAPTEDNLDAQGDLKSNVENAEKKAIENAELEKQFDGKVGDVLMHALDILDMSMKDIENMDEDELEDLLLKAFKIELKQQSNQPQPQPQQQVKESLDPYQTVIEEEKDSPIKKARRILAIKHKQKKSIEKIGGRKYALNQNEIIKMMSRYGYKYDRKYKKWAKKRSPTYDARRILSDKYQDILSVQKDEEGKYKLDQDEIRKRMHAHNYVYDLDKKRWQQKFEQPEQPKQVQPEPVKPYVPSTASIFQPTPVKTPEEPEIKSEVKPETKEEPPKEKEEKPVNPVYTLANRDKIKEMEARFILAVTNSLKDVTDFNKNEETGEYEPVVSKEDVLNKISMLNYTWHDDKNVWLNDANTLPQKMFDLNESAKTIMARAYLASINKVNKLKVKENGTPSVDIDEIDDAMEKEDLYFNQETNRWKVIEEDDEEELDEAISLSDVNDVDHNEEDLCEEYNYEQIKEEQEAEIKSLEEAAKEFKPTRKYNPRLVGEAQGRFILRSVQLNDYMESIGTPTEPAMKINLITNGPQDCVGQNGKDYIVDISVVEKDLQAMGLSFNGDSEFPMWIDGGNDVPKVLSDLIQITKQDYIARGILGSNNSQYIKYSFPKSKNDQISPIISNKNVTIDMESHPNGYTWNDEYGWILPPRNSNIIPSKAERQNAQELLALKKTPYNSLDKNGKNKIKDVASKNILEHYGKKPYDQMTDAEKDHARKQRDKYNDWDENTHKFTKRKAPRPGTLRNIWNGIWNIAGKIKRFSGMTGSNVKAMINNWTI